MKLTSLCKYALQELAKRRKYGNTAEAVAQHILEHKMLAMNDVRPYFIASCLLDDKTIDWIKRNLIGSPQKTYSEIEKVCLNWADYTDGEPLPEIGQKVLTGMKERKAREKAWKERKGKIESTEEESV